MKKNQIIFLMLLFVLLKINSSFSQNFSDSIKIDEKYIDKKYDYVGIDELRSNLDCSLELRDVCYFLRIDTLKRYYKVHDISIYKNLDGKKFYFIEISDFTERWYWTLVTEYSKDSCRKKIKKNRLYYMEIGYFEGEKYKVREYMENTYVNYNNNYKIIIHDIKVFHRFVYSPNLFGRCFIP
jgi:hypothetical protein